jgi:hypothetical protein
MMPTFPSPSLKFRTAGLPRYGFKAGISDRAFPFGAWPSRATLDWVDWFNTRRLLEPIGYVPPADYEARYAEQLRRHSTQQDVNAAAAPWTAAVPRTSTPCVDEVLAGGIQQPAPLDDRRSWGML